jgi:hypothetical protein
MSERPVVRDKQEIYRERAEECLRLARRSIYPKERAEWETLANEWLKLAGDCERMHAPDPPADE